MKGRNEKRKNDRKEWNDHTVQIEVYNKKKEQNRICKFGIREGGRGGGYLLSLQFPFQKKKKREGERE
jgi:hypothetical protein